MPSIADIRINYTKASLNETDAHADAIQQFSKWWEEAVASDISEVNAMTLATVDAQNIPQARIVLLKGFDSAGFTFFTNYNSAKGRQLAHNKNACLVFFWKELERQVRITGGVEKVSAAESIAYFNSRPDGSKLGAWASPQSSVVSSINALTDSFVFYQDKFKNTEIPKPPHWGGYRVMPATIEFWQGRPSRMHDRLLYTKTATGWQIERLAP